MKGEGLKALSSTARRFAALGCGALLLSGVFVPAYAGMFDDEEARRQIAVEKRRVDDLRAQQQANEARMETRMAKFEEALKSQGLLDLFTQLEALKLEMNKLRGQLEVVNNNIENTAKRQRDMYVDLDTRVRRFEQSGAAPAAAAPGGMSSSIATAPSGSPSVPSAPASSPAPAAAVDAAAENRVYDAAQSQRRNGNYQAAIIAFQNFLKQYPRSNLAARAQYWIGDSYFNIRDYRAAIANQQNLIGAYPDSSTVPDALLNIASSQLEMGEAAAGRRTLEELAAKYPLSEAADKAKRRLGGATTAKQR